MRYSSFILYFFRTRRYSFKEFELRKCIKRSL